MLYYTPLMPGRDKALGAELRQLSRRFPQWGYRPIRNKLSHRASYGRVHRVWRAEGLSLPRKRKSKRIRGTAHRWMSAIVPNSIWAYDFVFDACANGQKLKCLTIVDEWTRECLAIAPAARLRSYDVVCVLNRLIEKHGAPAFVRSDNGPEFVAKYVQSWLGKKGIATSYIQPGRPWQNGIIESFNARFRADCLDIEWFKNRREAAWVIERWRKEYNEERPHGGIGYQTPSQCRIKWQLNQEHIKKEAA